MDNELFLQRLRDLSLEEGRIYIQRHIEELADYAAIGNVLADEALNQLYTDPSISLKLAEFLISFGQYVSHISSYALGLKAKGDALRVIGHHQAAMNCLDAAGEEFLRLGDERNWARSRISWVLAAAWLGHIEEALQQAERARDVFLSLGEYLWACIVDSNTAIIYDNIGRYQDELKLYERMLSIYPKLTDQSEAVVKRAIAIAQANQSVCISWLGDFEEAYHLGEEAQAMFIALEETSCVINTEINLADLDYTQGYYGSALRRYYQALDTITQNNVDNPMLLAELKLWMANCLVKLNRSQEACSLADEAVEIYRGSGISLSTGIALREYATILLASSRSKDALAALDEAWTLFHHGGFYPYAAATKLQQAELLLDMGDVAEAYDRASHIKQYFEAQDLVSRSVRARLVMAGALLENAKQALLSQEKEQRALLLHEAILLCKEAVSQARKHNLQEEVYKCHYLLGKLFAFQENTSKARWHYSAAIAQIERILDDLVYDLSPSFLHTTWCVYEDMITLCLQQAQFERAFSYLEQARSMALRQHLNQSHTSWSKRVEEKDSPSHIPQPNSAMALRIQKDLKDWQEIYRDYSVMLANIDTSVSPTVDLEVIQAELKRCETKISELFERLHLYQSGASLKPHRRKRTQHQATLVDIVQLRQHLSPDQLLLAYFQHKEKLIIFALTRERLITHENPEGAAQLERLLPLLHAHLQPAGWPDPSQPPQLVIQRLLNKLYNLLVAPITAILPPQSGSLTIVPYGLLHKLPFHALYDGSNFLVERFQISYLPASTILMHLDTRINEQTAYSTDAGDSKSPPLVLGYSGNGHLQRVLDEAKELSELLGGQCYLESEATISRLIAQSPGSPIIHLATHGQSRLDAPNFSYVRLADGQLNAIDTFNLNIQGCELVTLSGCETGLALTGGGDEQLGLGRAFLAAGAESLVMSLWPVEDNATSELMQLFYQNLMKGESKVEALRLAQCSLMYRQTSIYSHPYFWAAFRLVGEVGPLHYQK